jgi:methylmalonyl-CoA/ethylmalonyl-CoA epimerase
VLKRIDHIGIIVEDLDQARKFLESLGMELERAQEVPERNVKLAFYRCGDGRIELIEPTSEESRQRRLGEGNRARIEHIGVEVEDISLTMEAVRGLGVQLTADQPIPVGPNLNAWTQPESSEGMQFQLVQRDSV